MFCAGIETEVVMKPAEMILLLNALAMVKISSPFKQSPLLNLSSLSVDFKILSKGDGAKFPLERAVLAGSVAWVA